MKLLVLTFIDKHGTYDQLINITKPNHESYCSKHNYDYKLEILPCDITHNVCTPELSLERSKLVRKYIDEYDVVVEIGCDIIFTNFNKNFQDIILQGDNMIIAREQKNTWPINDDVMVWVKTEQSKLLLDTIISSFSVWRHMKYIRQSWLVEVINGDNSIKDTIRVVDARVMNSHPPSGDVNDIDPAGRWQRGDFICHCLGMYWNDKLTAARWMVDNAIL